MTTQHALGAPSSLALIVACRASLKLQLSVPLLPPTEEELEGTAAHWIAQQYAAGYAANWPVGAKFKSGGREWTVDLDMVTGATMYARAAGGPHPYLRLEEAVRISRIHPEHCYGTPDGWRMFTNPSEAWPVELPGELAQLPEFVPARAKLVRVIDYKYGHRYVEVFENYQLAAYARGVMEHLELTDNDPDLWLELIVVQPRNYHRDGPVRRWFLHASDLRAMINIAHAALREALESPNPTATTGDHCTDCKARHACSAYQRLTYACIDFSTTAEVVNMPPDALGQELNLVDEAIARLEARRTGLAAQAEALLRTGKSIALYHMEAGESRLVYRDDVSIDEVVGLGDLLGIELRKLQKLKDVLVTPTQAVQLGIDEGVIAAYAHRPPAALKLARDNSTIARKVFAK